MLPISSSVERALFVDHDHGLSSRCLRVHLVALIVSIKQCSLFQRDLRVLAGRLARDLWEVVDVGINSFQSIESLVGCLQG